MGEWRLGLSGAPACAASASLPCTPAPAASAPPLHAPLQRAHAAPLALLKLVQRLALAAAGAEAAGHAADQVAVGAQVVGAHARPLQVLCLCGQVGVAAVGLADERCAAGQRAGLLLAGRGSGRGALRVAATGDGVCAADTGAASYCGALRRRGQLGQPVGLQPQQAAAKAAALAVQQVVDAAHAQQGVSGFACAWGGGWRGGGCSGAALAPPTQMAARSLVGGTAGGRGPARPLRTVAVCRPLLQQALQLHGVAGGGHGTGEPGGGPGGRGPDAGWFEKEQVRKGRGGTTGLVCESAASPRPPSHQAHNPHLQGVDGPIWRRRGARAGAGPPSAGWRPVSRVCCSAASAPARPQGNKSPAAGNWGPTAPGARQEAVQYT